MLSIFSYQVPKKNRFFVRHPPTSGVEYGSAVQAPGRERRFAADYSQA
jgi:hypothetical protein